MPCESSYLEPTRREQELQRTAQLLVYVHKQLGITSDVELLTAARAIYCRADFVPALCTVLRGLDPAQLDHIVYNARSKESRDLADWWERHQEADRKREAAEQRDAERVALRASALAKLTPAPTLESVIEAWWDEPNFGRGRDANIADLTVRIRAWYEQYGSN